MNLHFDFSRADGYKSNSQKARVLSENWVESNIYCPTCGKVNLERYPANKPVGDFYCIDCQSDYELKSVESPKGTLGSRISDGAYKTMIERIESAQNPNFFFLTYHNWFVNNLIIIPNHFFTAAIIEKRKPLADTARRAGWIGCNINIQHIPESGKIFLIQNGQNREREKVVADFRKTLFLRKETPNMKGWILDVLLCIDRIPTPIFSLNDVYSFENELKQKHPNNQFVKDKIRQQLQVLRDEGYIEFTSRGHYKKIG